MSDVMASIADFINAHPLTCMVILTITLLVYGIGGGA